MTANGVIRCSCVTWNERLKRWAVLGRTRIFVSCWYCSGRLRVVYRLS